MSAHPEPVSMRKAGSGGTRGSGAPERAPVAIPRTVEIACFVIGLTVLFVVAHIVLSRAFTPQLKHLLTHLNATAKKPDKDFDAVSRLADFRRSILIQGLVLVAALSLFAAGLRRVRFANGARWALIVVLLVLGMMTGWLVIGPLAIVPISGYPLALQVVRCASGAGSIAIIVLLVVSRSREYFRTCRALTHPGAPERPGLAGLFGPRRPPARAAGAEAGSSAAPPARDRARGRARAASDNPSRGRVKAKVRVDGEAVAKGADLARARAKASKPRRTE